MAARVQVWSCDSEGHRVPMVTVNLDYLLTYAAEQLPAHVAEQLRDDLTVLGKARIDGNGGKWFEYTIVSQSPNETRNTSNGRN